MCGGDVKVEQPEQTAAEKETAELQLAMLQDVSGMLPLLYEQMGYSYTEPSEGTWEWLGDEEGWVQSGAVEGGWSYAEPEKDEITQLLEEQLIAALKGEAEISPALESSLLESKTQLEENLSRKLGSDWGLSTAGIQSMAAFDEYSELVREEARQGILGDYTSMLTGYESMLSGTGATDVSSLFGSTATASSTGNNLLSYYSNLANMGLQADVYNSQNSGSDLMSSLGMITGMAGGGLLSNPSLFG